MRLLIIPLLSFFLINGCCQPKMLDPKPSKDLSELVTRSVHNWLDVRMDDNSYQKIYADDAQWKKAQSVAEVADWFEDNLGIPLNQSELWNFHQLDNDIQASELYQRGPPSPQDYLSMIKTAIESYKPFYSI